MIYNCTEQYYDSLTSQLAITSPAYMFISGRIELAITYNMASDLKDILLPYLFLSTQIHHLLLFLHVHLVLLITINCYCYRKLYTSLPFIYTVSTSKYKNSWLLTSANLMKQAMDFMSKAFYVVHTCCSIHLICQMLY